jgi:hypothetical protein
MQIYDGQPFPMVQLSHHDPADHDPERRWVEGATIYGCTGCEHEIVVLPAGHGEADAGPG